MPIAVQIKELVDNREMEVPYNFDDITNLKRFGVPGFSRAIYTASLDRLWDENISGSVLDENNRPAQKSMSAFRWSLYRILKLQVALSKMFVGYEEQVRMTLACAIAQEPVLFVGKPGVAKTELAVNFFNGIGLRKPRAEASEGELKNKYFEYLLSSFTIPEELFGPLDLNLFSQGIVTRINDNMVTGKLVRGVFLDEIFNASSSILNTLLTLINERRYFDRGMFQDADLRVFIGASNRTPAGKYGSGDGMGGGRSGEFEAFYDRFTVRLYFPTPQELHESQPYEVAEAYAMIDKVSRDRFMERLTCEHPGDFSELATLNDVLLLGRVLGKVQIDSGLDDLKNRLVTGLAMNRPGRDLCLMSPRKPNKLRPIMIADALLLDLEKIRDEHVRQGGQAGTAYDGLNTERLLEYVLQKPKVAMHNLRVFNHIWDYEGDRRRLADEVQILLENGS
ncbi:hypothetical protein SBDP2_330007 [Syntrophobacter sp. SbD2]|nr:hypothetical protein SBDP2_330007 [Syntrophobacter sp. SbD2]